MLNLALDAPVFIFGPLAMPLGDYFDDIGLTYVMFPIITIGLGWLLQVRQK